MTAKQELAQLLDRMSEEQAAMLLTEGRQIVERVRDVVVAGRPTFVEIARMSLAEREPYLTAMHFEIDEDELREWDEATGAGVDDDE